MKEAQDKYSLVGLKKHLLTWTAFL